ncbi:MAG: hypothetical protein KME60_09785 [Cyanomargarita calcarea GSE-NOS-MK-12-04C]|uniref:Uncharacterized protein n=1 Tax=Cyanomargarita calcarea GSE-NOS-MK-12-04C TaxID=2839659 RepID=A0A951US96_9CYAN|nr:hypothetical protein [Cyanomargarita calcarea GSE-NOS-MK-12-04C]
MQTKGTADTQSIEQVWYYFFEISGLAIYTRVVQVVENCKLIRCVFMARRRPQPPNNGQPIKTESGGTRLRKLKIKIKINKESKPNKLDKTT